MKLFTIVNSKPPPPPKKKIMLLIDLLYRALAIPCSYVFDVFFLNFIYCVCFYISLTFITFVDTFVDKKNSLGWKLIRVTVSLYVCSIYIYIYEY